MKKLFLFTTLFLSIILGILGVSAEQPIVKEIVTCGFLSEKNQPQKIKNVFSQNEQIYIFISWENVQGKHEVKIKWFDPKGELKEITTIPFESKSGKYNTWAWLKFVGTIAETLYHAIDPEIIGQWTAKIYLDGKMVKEDSFSVTP